MKRQGVPSRRVIVTLEVETDIPRDLLRRRQIWEGALNEQVGMGQVGPCSAAEVIQVQVNVAKPRPKNKRRAA